MNSLMDELSNKFKSNDIVKCVEGIDTASLVIKEIIDSTLNLFNNNNLDKFIVAERISVIFDNYIISLKKLWESKNPDVKFFAACLLVHHTYNTNDIEDFLLEISRNEDTEKVHIANRVLSSALVRGTRNKKG
jgi:transposase-like protein